MAFDSKKITIFWFSGVGNSYLAAKWIKDELQNLGWQINWQSIEKLVVEGKSVLPSQSLVIYPVYGFASPNIVWRFINNCQQGDSKISLLVTKGGEHGEGISIVEVANVLAEKGYKIQYTESLRMPDSWLMIMSEKKRKDLLTTAELGARAFAATIEKNQHGAMKNAKLRSNFAATLFRMKGRHWLAKFMSRSVLCNGCGLCAKICPVQAIEIKQGKLNWMMKCEQCMRCVNFCPQKAIKQFWRLGFKNKHYNEEFLDYIR